MVSLNTRVTQLEEKLAMLLAHDSQEVTKTKTKAKTKVKTKLNTKVKTKLNTNTDTQVKVEDDKKKRLFTSSGYILYCNANRSEVKDRLIQQAGDQKLKNTDVMKELASMWRQLDEQQKQIWNTQSNFIRFGQKD